MCFWISKYPFLSLSSFQGRVRGIDCWASCWAQRTTNDCVEAACTAPCWRERKAGAASCWTEKATPRRGKLRGEDSWLYPSLSSFLSLWGIFPSLKPLMSHSSKIISRTCCHLSMVSSMNMPSELQSSWAPHFCSFTPCFVCLFTPCFVFVCLPPVLEVVKEFTSWNYCSRINRTP